MCAACALALLVAGCGGSGFSVAASTAPVKTFLTAITKISTDHLALHPLDAAMLQCSRLGDGVAAQVCFRKLATTTPSVGQAPAGSADACRVLTPAAWSALTVPTATKNIAQDEVETGGRGYPPTCPDLFRILLINGSGGPSTAAAGVMDFRLQDRTRTLSSLSVAVVSHSTHAAVLRVGDSKKTVKVIDVHGVWKIAALNYSDLP